MYDFNLMMIDELLSLYVFQENKEALDEVYRRLRFCNYDSKTIDFIIDYEIKIIKKRNLIFKDYLFNKYWWLKHITEYRLDDNKKLFNLNRDEYIFAFYNYMSDNILTISELICIFDEAYFIKSFCKNYPQNVLDEVREIATYEDDRSWIIEEIYSRIETLYRLANDIKNDNKKITDIKKTHTLYDNELQILFVNKWRKSFGDESNWQPYTDDYYEYLEDYENRDKN